MRSLSEHNKTLQFMNKAIRQTKVGVVIECGVYEGVTSYLMRQYHSRKQYAFDTFDGMPYDGTKQELEGGFRKGYLAPTKQRDGIIKRLSNAGIDVRVGLIENTLMDAICGQYVAFAWIDLDLEKPTRFTVESILPRLEDGAIIGFHDYMPNEKGYCLASIARIVDEIAESKTLTRLPSPNRCQFLQYNGV